MRMRRIRSIPRRNQAGDVDSFFSSRNQSFASDSYSIKYNFLAEFRLREVLDSFLIVGFRGCYEGNSALSFTSPFRKNRIVRKFKEAKLVYYITPTTALPITRTTGEQLRILIVSYFDPVVVHHNEPAYQKNLTYEQTILKSNIAKQYLLGLCTNASIRRVQNTDTFSKKNAHHGLHAKVLSKFLRVAFFLNS